MESYEIIVDERVFLGTADIVDMQKAFVLDVAKLGGTMIFSEFPLRNPGHRPEAIAVAGLAVSIVGTIISLLALVQGRKRMPTLNELYSEISAYQALKGLTEYKLKRLDDFENVASNNGMPCKIVFEGPNGTEASAYFGIHRKRIWVAATETEWRTLVA